MTKALENSLFATLMVMAVSLVSYISIVGIPSSIVAIVIIYVTLGGFYTGYKFGITAKVKS